MFRDETISGPIHLLKYLTDLEFFFFLRCKESSDSFQEFLFQIRSWIGQIFNVDVEIDHLSFKRLRLLKLILSSRLQAIILALNKLHVSRGGRTEVLRASLQIAAARDLSGLSDFQISNKDLGSLADNPVDGKGIRSLLFMNRG